ncbi:MAG: tripartite tricarboxylate transporter permease [Candidatus Methanomethylophilaceae archaeon]
MDPAIVSFIIIASLIGASLGTFTGLMPGIHVNTLASIMLVSYPAMESALSGLVDQDYISILVCCCIMSASVVHSFVDFVPSVFIGAPDAEDSVSILPGHRMVLQGRGMAAVRAAAIGSLVGCSVAIALSVPLQFVMLNGAEDVMDRLTPLVLLVASSILILNEGRKGNLVWGVVCFILSGAIGMICMFLPIPSDGILGEGTLMFPMLTGLFGIPVLVEAASGNGIPAQRDDEHDPVGLVPGIKGVVTGCIAGWFPGITSTVGASMSACFMPENRPERFISTVASVGTVTSVLSLVTLSVSGSGRSGSAIVIGEIMGDGLSGFMSEGFLMLLMATATASVLGYGLTIWAGRIMSSLVSRIDERMMNRAVIVLLLVLVVATTGPAGLMILAGAVAVGFIPNACGTGRTVLCGCLILPVLLPM